MRVIRFSKGAAKSLAAITAAGIGLALQAAPSSSTTSPPDETIAFGEVYHLNRCVASMGSTDASLEVWTRGRWEYAARGPLVRDDDCAAANPNAPYTAPNLRWEPTAPGTYSLRLSDDPVKGTGSEAWALKVTSGDPSALTKIRYRVKGCENCLIQPHRVSARGSTYLDYPRVRVRNGRAVSLVPTRRTRGMAISINARRWNPPGAIPLVIVRYAGTTPGQKVSPSRARQSSQGTDCWAGTSRRTVTLKIRTERFRRQPTIDPRDRGRRIIVWTSPVLKDFHAYRNMEPLIDHGHSFNGAPSC